MARKWTALIVHHSASPQSTTAEDVDRWHRARGFAGIGYHFYLAISSGHGYLKRARADTKAGAHTIGWNSKALGLCVPGNYSETPMSEVIYQDLLAAVLHICRKYQIPASQVYGHRDKYATACPGDKFPLARLKADVKRELG